MSDASTILSLPYIQSAQAQKHVTHNEAIQSLDVLVQLSALTQGQTTPASGPQEGDRHIIGNPATGDWAGRADEIAVWLGGGWQFFVPQAGWRAWVADTGTLMVYDGNGWRTLEFDTDNLGGIGINATSDATNRLTLSAPASLFTHEGAGHQLKINKNLPGDTASLLYQTGFSGRAEMGLSGSDSFAIKTSADGSSWVDALLIDGAGNTGIGVTSPSERLEVAGNVLADAHLTPSDRRLKTAIAPADTGDALIDRIEVVRFDWKTGGHVPFGMIAQDLAKIMPQAVTPGCDNPAPDQAWSIDLSALVPLLIAQIQSLRQRISALEAAS